MPQGSDLAALGMPIQWAEFLGNQPQSIAAVGTALIGAATITQTLASVYANAGQTAAMIAPTAPIGSPYYVALVGGDGTAAKIFPPSGHSMNGVLNSSVMLTTSASAAAFVQWSAKEWYSVPPAIAPIGPGGALLAANNLSDVASASASRINLGFGGAKITFGGGDATYTPPNPNIYYFVPFTTVPYNQGSLWAAQASVGAAFKPPAGTSLVRMDAQIFVTAGAASPPGANWVIKWIKNATINGGGFQLTGTDVLAGIGWESGAGAGTVVMRASGEDAPAPGDYYNLFIFVDSTSLGSAVVTINGNNAHSYAFFSVAG